MGAAEGIDVDTGPVKRKAPGHERHHERSLNDTPAVKRWRAFIHAWNTIQIWNMQVLKASVCSNSLANLASTGWSCALHACGNMAFMNV